MLWTVNCLSAYGENRMRSAVRCCRTARTQETFRFFCRKPDGLIGGTWFDASGCARKVIGSIPGTEGHTEGCAKPHCAASADARGDDTDIIPEKQAEASTSARCAAAMVPTAFRKSVPKRRRLPVARQRWRRRHFGKTRRSVVVCLLYGSDGTDCTLEKQDEASSSACCTAVMARTASRKSDPKRRHQSDAKGDGQFGTSRALGFPVTVALSREDMMCRGSRNRGGSFLLRLLRQDFEGFEMRYTARCGGTRISPGCFSERTIDLWNF